LTDYDAVVVGGGPNGLAAAITVATAGLSVIVLEGAANVGGGMRSEELIFPGFLHDVCSAVHPLAIGSPYFRTLPLSQHGLDFVHSPAALAHPLEGDRSVIVERSLEETADSLGADSRAYLGTIGSAVDDWEHLEEALLGPLIRFPRHPFELARFGLSAARSATGFTARFAQEETRALFAGAAAHSVLPLEQFASASFGIVLLALAHARGWPIIRGGTQKLSDALAAVLVGLGGTIQAGVGVRSLDQLPSSKLVFFDIGPRQFVQIAGARFSPSYRRALLRYRYGPGVFKIDYALDGPIPWNDPACAQAATVHLGGTIAEIAASERAPWQGRHAERPFVLLAQPSLFDLSRAPEGKHTAWAYCHVPQGSTVDMTGRIEAQIERFANGFRDRILGRSTLSPAELESRNPNLVGGDVNGGAATFRQLVARPTLRPIPYTTPVKGMYLCSASTPPGGGVHGMCGHLAARTALRRDIGVC
jgi:phytoene dehydrogenase-like protein